MCIERLRGRQLTGIFTHGLQDRLDRLGALLLDLRPAAGQDGEPVEAELVLAVLNVAAGDVQDCLRKVVQLWSNQDSGKLVLNLKSCKSLLDQNTAEEKIFIRRFTRFNVMMTLSRPFGKNLLSVRRQLD